MYYCKSSIITFSMLILVLVTPVCFLHADGSHPSGINLDGSIGNAGALVLEGPNYEIKADYGSQAGGNLFHSFNQFNVHSGESATFSGPDSVQNIISRVTGGDASWIDGKLGSSIPNADMYFLNPAGVMFGSDVSLDLGGSFHVSTADYLRMGENDRFYSALGESDVLSVSAPTAFGFLDNDAAPISFESRGSITEPEWAEKQTGLYVADGKTISIVGGDVEIKNGTSFEIPIFDQNGNLIFIQASDESGNPIFETEVDENGNPVLDENGEPVYKLDENGEQIPVYILDAEGNPVFVTRTITPGDVEAPGGRINIAAVGSEGEVVLKDDDLDASSFTHMGEIKISDNAIVELNSGNGGGSLYIRAGQFAVDNSIVKSNTGGEGNGKDIDIEADDLKITGGAGILCGTYASGTGGNINIRVKDSMVISGENSFTGRPSNIEASTQDVFGPGGKAGTIELEAKQLEVSDGAQISSHSNGSGQGGEVKIRVTDTVSLSGEGINFTGIFATSQGQNEGAGAGGIIELLTSKLNIVDGAQITVASFGYGQGGDINIQADDSINLSGEGSYSESGIFSSTQGIIEEAGVGGTIELITGSLYLTEGARIISSSRGPGQAGCIKIHSDYTVALSGENSVGNASSILSSSEGETEKAGKGGLIELTTGDLTLNEGAQINATTFGPGQGGDIKLQITDSVTLSGEGSLLGYSSGIFASTQDKIEGAGKGGIIELTAEKLNISNGAQITAATFGSGQGGDIQVHVEDLVTLSGQGSEEHSGIFVNAKGETEKAGGGGTIELTAGKLQISEGAQIVSRTHGAGEGGSMKLQIEDSITISDKGTGENPSGIYAGTTGESEYAGDGGTIKLTADSLDINESARITTSSLGNGTAGDIYLQINNLKLNNNASITSAGDNSGNAGTIAVNANDSINLSGNSTLNTDAQSAGGGIIKISAENNLTLSNANISTDVMDGTGNGGDISIGNPEFVILNQGQITADAYEGDGGAIFINTDNYIKSQDSKITATSKRGNDGTVKIEAPDMDISSSLMLLPSGYIDASKWIKRPCAARTGQNVSRFLIKGRDGKAFTFEDWLPGAALISDADERR